MTEERLYTPTHCSVEEQETTVTKYRNDNYFTVYTSDNTVLTRIAKFPCYRLVKVSYDKYQRPTGYFFTTSHLYGLTTYKRRKKEENK